MSIRDDQRERVVERLAAHLLETGLAQTSLRQLAAAAGVSDRMLLYYFADKVELLSAVLARIAASATVGLGEAMPDGQTFTPAQFILRATEVTARPEMRRFMRLWIAVIAAAAKGEEPFVSISAQIVAGFQQWGEARLELPVGADRAGLALAMIAVIDGLAVVEICSGEALAARASGALGSLLAGPLA